MQSLHRISAAVALCVLSACSGDDGGVAPPPPPGEASYHWMNPVSRGVTLTDAWGAMGDDLFATGNGGLVLRYDGDVWRRTQAPTNENLNAIWGVDADHIFAVGPKGTILFFNGTSWVEQTSPTTKALNDVWGTSATNVYAVGEQREILHFDGTSWQRDPIPLGIESLRSIWGSGPDNIYVVGLGKNLLQYDGDSWGVDSTHASFALNSVWGTDSLGVFAVGGNGAAVRYDGAWNNIDVGEPLFALSVWGTSSTDVYAMGFASASASAGYHWDGLSWSPVTMHTIKGINSVFGVDGVVVAVGSAGLVHEKKSALEFSPVPGGLTVDLRSVWVSSSGTEAFAVGDLGTILHYEHGTWTPMASGTAVNLRGVGGACSCSPIAVGENGLILRYNGADWLEEASGVVSHLNAVWVDASGTAFVVGEDMAVLRSDGSGWSPLSLGTVMGGFLSVWGASTDNVYMVGFGNTAFVWNGTGFKSILIQPNAYHNFHGVFGTGPDDVYVATEVISPPPPGPAHAGGNIFRWDGDAWTPVFAEPVHDVLSVWRHGRQGFATGDSSSLLRDSGTGTWSRVLDVENLPYYVNSVHGSSLSNVLIVGNDGAIIRYGP